MSTDVLVILRCLNDAWVVGETLEAIFGQREVRPRVVAIDSGSTDGSLDILRRFPLELMQIAPGTYIPGRVLNLGMRQGAEPIAAFVNSDCTPQHDRWLERLVAPFASDDRIAAVYGRQIPRPGAHPLVRLDYERAFGDGSEAARWRHFFSMASSAVRRSVWAAAPFDEQIRYSEDVLWSWQRRQEGWRIVYAAESVAMHSHNYSLAEMRRRYAGEGRADAAIFPPETHPTGFGGGLLRPWLAAVARDGAWCVRHGHWRALFESPVHRWVQRASYRSGLCEGLGRG